MISFCAQASLPSDYIIRAFFHWPRGKKHKRLVSTLPCHRRSHSIRRTCLDTAFHGLKTGFKQVSQSRGHELTPPTDRPVLWTPTREWALEDTRSKDPSCFRTKETRSFISYFCHCCGPKIPDKYHHSGRKG